MIKKNYIIVGVASTLLIFALGSTVAGIATATIGSNPLEIAHQKEMECEIKTKEKLLEKDKILKQLEAIEYDLEALRQCREGATKERIDFMNVAEAATFTEFNTDLQFGSDLKKYLEEKPLVSGSSSSPLSYEKQNDYTKEDYLNQACKKHAKNPDYCYKIMTGVFVADSSWCTKGAGAKNNNCGNIRPGSGKYGDKDVQWTSVNNFRHYETLRDGIFDNVALYAQLYEGKSLDYMRRVWAGGSYNWMKIVASKL